MRWQPLLSGPLSEPAKRGFVPIGLAAMSCCRSERTVRTWIREGGIRTEVHNGQTLVFWYEVLKRSEERGRRARLQKRRS